MPYELIFPEYLDGYENETEAKGYLAGVRVAVGDRVIEFVVYDPARLAQEVGDAVGAGGYFAAGCLLVVPRVTRAEIARAMDERGYLNLE